MSSNVCGNCANFNPKQGDKFFNCTYAQQGGVRYGMQVRLDTKSCEAFAPLSQAAKPQTAAKRPPPSAGGPPPRRAAPPPRGVCNWGRVILLAVIIIIIIALIFGAYTCFSNRGTSTPTPTPTPSITPVPTPIPTPTQAATPTPTPTPTPIYEYDLGVSVSAPPLLLLASSAEKTYNYDAPGPHPPPVGTSWVIVTVSLFNGGSQALTTAATDFTVVMLSPPGFSPIGAQQLPFMFVQAYPYVRSTLNPGTTISGRIVFAVPDAFSDLRLQTSTGNGTIRWILPW